jgi:CRP-like cAMP-binding protein
MSAKILGQNDNHLISSLPKTQRRNFLKLCDRVDLSAGDDLCQKNQNIEYVYFPETSILCLVSLIRDHVPFGINLIGNEGMLDVVLILGDDFQSFHGATVQNSGTALRMKVSQFRHQLLTCSNLRIRLNQYLYYLIKQISQSLACVHFHNIEPRLARWLLMTQDRAHSKNFYLTHKLLANMLGVRRSGITIAAGILQEHKLIAYNRGNISVLDRKGLEAVSCECYLNSVIP